MKKILFLAPLLVSLTLLIPSQAVMACTPPPGGLPHYTTAEHVQAAPVVLEGVVSYTSFVNFYVTATVQVVQYIKGNGPATVEISNFGDSSVCLSDVNDGDHLIFLASGDPSSGELQAFYMSQFDAVLPADADTVGEAISAAGQDPVVVAPLESVLTQAAMSATPSIDETSAVATINAAAGIDTATPEPFPTNDVGQSLTEAWATIEASGAPIVIATPVVPPAVLVSSGPTTGSTSMEAVGLIGVGIVIGLLFGGLVGVIVGLIVGRWRE
jgi:hypothetical protein